MALTVEFDYYNNNPLLRLRGEPSPDSLPKLALAAELHFRTATGLYLLDLGNLDIADSLFISSLLSLHLRYAKGPSRLVLLNVGPRLGNALVATGLDQVLHLDEAVLPPGEVYASGLST